MLRSYAHFVSLLHFFFFSDRTFIGSHLSELKSHNPVPGEMGGKKVSFLILLRQWTERSSTYLMILLWLGKAIY